MSTDVVPHVILVQCQAEDAAIQARAQDLHWTLYSTSEGVHAADLFQNVLNLVSGSTWRRKQIGNCTRIHKRCTCAALSAFRHHDVLQFCRNGLCRCGNQHSTVRLCVSHPSR